MTKNLTNSQTNAHKAKKQYEFLDSDNPTKPQLKRHSLHIYSLVASIIQIYLIVYIGNILCSTQQQQKWLFSIQFIIFLYIVFGLLNFLKSNHRNFISNMKKLAQMQEVHKQIKNQKLYIILNIQCYHYFQQPKKKTRKVTHTANKKVQITECYDSSGFLMPSFKDALYFTKPLLFLQYSEPKISFIDNDSEKVYEKQYLKFIEQNKKDKFQIHQKIFQSQSNQKRKIGFSSINISYALLVGNLIACIVGIGWPFCVALQYFVCSYRIQLIKKIKLKDKQFIQQIL